MHRWRKSALKVGDNRGISIIEILMVALALAVLAGMGMPSLLRTLDAYRLRGAAWEMAGDLRLARQKAVSLQQRHRICFADCASPVPAGGYLLERKADPAVPDPGGWLLDLTRTNLPNGVNFTFTGDKVTYDTKGEAFGSTITLTNSVGTYAVVASPSGRVRACKGSCL